MPRTAIGPAYKLTIISSTPSKRRDPFGTTRGPAAPRSQCRRLAMRPSWHTNRCTSSSCPWLDGPPAWPKCKPVPACRLCSTVPFTSAGTRDRPCPSNLRHQRQWHRQLTSPHADVVPPELLEQERERITGWQETIEYRLAARHRRHAGRADEPRRLAAPSDPCR